MRMEGKVALISGGAAGIKGELMGFGGTVAWMILNEGGKVVIGDINTVAAATVTAAASDATHAASDPALRRVVTGETGRQAAR